MTDANAGSIEFAAANFTYDENVGTAKITLARLGGSNDNVSVQFATSDGTYVATDKYTSLCDSISFSAGVASKTIAISSGDGYEVPDTIAANESGRVVAFGQYVPPVMTVGGSTLPALGMGNDFMATLVPGNGTGGSGDGGNGGGSVAPLPTFQGESRLTSGKGPKKKITVFQLNFSTALDARVAQNVDHDRVAQPGRTKHSARKVVPVRAATVGPGSESLGRRLGKYNPKKSLSLTYTSLVGSGGTPATTIVTNL